MAAVRPSQEDLEQSMRNSSLIRNVCILAHVDHGKTTVADSLLATNRLVSKRLAGTLRYLDDRADEQKRKITMKSSAVSLLNFIHNDNTDEKVGLLLNVIDTPGHIDFSSEVSAAVKVCDGALILVDVVEGVCVQTKEAIKQAFEQRVKMILVLNKIDRLFTDLQKPTDLIFDHIRHIIEDCNVVIAELYHYEYINPEVDIEDANILFSPDIGNVIFASAQDGWGVTLKQIAGIFISKIRNETVESLNNKMWDFDNFVDAKTMEVKKGAIDGKKQNLFTQLLLKTIEHVYNTIVIRMDKTKLPGILEKLGIKTPTRDMSHNDPKIQIKAILQTWKPLADTILEQCLKVIPPPNQISEEKVDYLLNVNYNSENVYSSQCVESLKPYFMSCSSQDDAPLVVYVSKMFCVNKRNLSQNKPKVFIPGARPKLDSRKETSETKENDINTTQADEPVGDNVVVALARVFTGTLSVGQELYILNPKYIPEEDCNNSDEYLSRKNVQKVKVSELYMLLGRDLISVLSIPPGNICAIGGLETAVLRTATLSNSLKSVPFFETKQQDPVMRNAVEPVNPKDLPILRQGLRLLVQSDSCVQVITQETGEHVLLTAGDVHLEKCIEDLTTRFTNIEIQVSSPVVSLRETVLHTRKREELNSVDADAGPVILSLFVTNLPEDVSRVVSKNYDLLRLVEELDVKGFENVCEKKFKAEHRNAAIQRTKAQLKLAFEQAGESWIGLENNIWSVGNSDCTNLLINKTNDYKGGNIFYTPDSQDLRSCFEQCIVTAFNTCCKAGPICEEPITNCAFVVTQYKLNLSEGDDVRLSAQVSANVQQILRNAFREAFQKQPQRLMEPIFTTDIQVNTGILGKVYTVVNKRHGKVLSAVDMDEQEKTFLVKAQIPAIESVGFANEIRKTTSGQALPNLKFSHYEIVNGDPFYEPVSDDEDDDGTKTESTVRANRLRKEIRRRKGLYVDDQVVVHAEKQRTLNKKK